MLGAIYINIFRCWRKEINVKINYVNIAWIYIIGQLVLERIDNKFVLEKLDGTFCDSDIDCSKNKNRGVPGIFRRAYISRINKYNDS